MPSVLWHCWLGGRKGIRPVNKKLSYRRGTARCVVSVDILPIATQQCVNYLYDKIVLQTELDDLCDKLVLERQSSEVLST